MRAEISEFDSRTRLILKLSVKFFLNAKCWLDKFSACSSGRGPSGQSVLQEGVMDFFFSTKISIPLFQILLLLILSTAVLLYGKVRLALVINYIFTMYWGYVFNREYLRGFGYEKLDAFSLVYLAFGLVIVLLVFVGFSAQRE